MAKRLRIVIRTTVVGALVALSAIPRYAEAQVPGWQIVTEIPEPRAGAAVVEMDGAIYVIGGRGRASRATNTVFVYDPESNTWADGDDVPPALERARVNAAAAVLDGKIYVIGGRGPGGDVLQSVEVYDPESDTWLDFPDTKRQREGAAAIVLRGNLFVIGGSDQGERALDTVERFDVENDRWDEISEWRLDRPRVSAAAAVLDETVYIFGGFNTFGPVGQVHQYNALSGSVASIDMPLARGALGAAAVNSEIYVMGGRSQDRVLDMTQVLRPAELSWSRGPELNVARYGFAAVTVDTSVFVLGGLGGQNVPLASVEMYTPTIVSNEEMALPPDLVLEPPFPNPFGQNTRFEYSVSLSTSRHVTIQIMDVMGRLVKTVVDGPQAPGLKQAVWDGYTDSGLRAADGLYFIRMRQGPYNIIRKAVHMGG
jgi:N-acetylneuraminic acid mutarotase